MLFATQNPPTFYAGRKILSRAFCNRFVEIHVDEIPEDELCTILEKRCRAAFAGKHGFIIPRDLFRWANRFRELGISKEDLAKDGYFLLAERLRDDNEKAVVRDILEKHLNPLVEADLYKQVCFLLNSGWEEKEDDVVVRSDGDIGGFSFAAVFDGHAGFSSVEFLRLEETGKQTESGSTATAIFLRNVMLIVSHVLSRSGKAEVLTNPHRPYGNNLISRDQENQRSRVQFKGDLVTASPDIYQVALASDAEFLLLASDGLWGYVNSLDAVTFVRNQLREHGNVQRACEALAHAALDQMSQDNVSIIIADLGFVNLAACNCNMGHGKMFPGLQKYPPPRLHLLV
ncbi:hypothetical protein IFM89_027085 [Coptis chinensis]|uniref:protein-serine/threonine phosphatase n=1 Tax=Coptis chinensis TaxID=261450 RepID=A0A835LNP1_9MAGN|nr:hypothetical protein IFM89_027085 [Coptis chinensis]